MGRVKLNGRVPGGCGGIGVGRGGGGAGQEKKRSKHFISIGITLVFENIIYEPFPTNFLVKFSFGSFPTDEN